MMNSSEIRKQQAVSLFKQCFDDDDAFVDFYFRRRYTDENNIAICRDGTAIAALQNISYSLTFFDEFLPTAYLSGICTHPDFRNQGLMTQLLTQTHRKLFDDGVCFSTLIPATKSLAAMYEKYDYANVFFTEKTKVDTREFVVQPNVSVNNFTFDNFSKSFDYYTQKKEKINLCIQHSRTDFDIICEYIKLEGGVILFAERENIVVGLAFAMYVDEDATVLELLCDDDFIRQSLLKSLSEKMRCEELNVLDVPQKSAQALGMARVINAERVLQIFAKSNIDIEKKICLRDDIIAENNACYNIKNGACAKSKLNTDNAWSVRQLAEFIFGKNGRMSLMTNE